MAGDWIKIEHATPDKPEVFRMAMQLGITPEHVSGCLLRVWIWADAQTLDGNAVCVTGVTLDRIACHVGFAQAMKSVGWLVGDEANYSFPNFDRHNGKTSKTRAITRDRVKKHRNAKSLHGNGTVTPREEKRRDISTTDVVDITPGKQVFKFDPLRHLVEAGVSPQVAGDWMALRKSKRAATTKTGIAGIERESQKAGLSLEQARSMCCQRGWQGFRADWVCATGGYQTSADKRANTIAVLTGKAQQHDQGSKVIDGEVVHVAH